MNGSVTRHELIQGLLLACDEKSLPTGWKRASWVALMSLAHRHRILHQEGPGKNDPVWIPLLEECGCTSCENRRKNPGEARGAQPQYGGPLTGPSR